MLKNDEIDLFGDLYYIKKHSNVGKVKKSPQKPFIAA